MLIKKLINKKNTYLVLLLIMTTLIVSPVQAQAGQTLSDSNIDLANPNGNFDNTSGLLNFGAKLFGMTYDAGFVSITIDTKAMKYSSSITIENARENAQPEKRILYSLGDLDLAKNMPMTFPSERMAMTNQDQIGLQFVNTMLVPSLNNALSHLNDGRKFENLEELESATNALLKASNSGNASYNGYSLSRGASGDSYYAEFDYDYDNNGTSNKLPSSKYITISGKGRSVNYPFSIPKITSNESDPTKYINWQILVSEARTFRDVGLSSENVDIELAKQGPLMQVLLDTIRGLINGLNNILGLSSLTELIFNEGFRSHGLYVYGIFPQAWLPVIGTLFIVFQAIAWATLLFSIINLIFRKNLSTISSSMRVDVMLSLQRYIFAGIVLTLLFPILSAFFKLNYLLVDVFSNLVDAQAKSDFIANLPNHGGGIASVVAYFAYFIALLDINISYIIRGILVAILVIVSPLAIAASTISDAKRKVFSEWALNLTAYVFIQSIHALVLGFLMAIPIIGGSGLEPLVYVFSIIPVAEAIRRIIFAQGGKEIDGASDEARNFLYRGAILKGLGLFNKGLKGIKNNIGSYDDDDYIDGKKGSGGFGGFGNHGKSQEGVGNSVQNNSDKIKNSDNSGINENEKRFNFTRTDDDIEAPSREGFSSNYDDPKIDPGAKWEQDLAEEKKRIQIEKEQRQELLESQIPTPEEEEEILRELEEIRNQTFNSKNIEENKERFDNS